MCLCDMIVTTGTKVDFVHDWEDFLAAQHCILSSLFHLLPFTMTFFFFPLRTLGKQNVVLVIWLFVH